LPAACLLQTYVDSVNLQPSCATGKYDSKVGKCVVAAGGWGACPPGYATCLCSKNVEAFCTVAKPIYGLDACDLFCGTVACKDKKGKKDVPVPALTRVPCPAYRGKGYN
jgi:hypothetical protein